ncbi:lactococcin 972 family bacteriocin [Streptococcus halichoeri]|uniref:lactococcin 972 family bacteriocin n=1 Tax=Streptococcus halichoeri TaxID=254785 RepID=UPI001F167AB7|nr:lactococcin 972 family bacteriocin [Streptococcus halichoeri]
MKKLHKLLFVGAIASSLSAGSIAYAESVRTLGGTWNDDYGVGYAYSHYQHDYNNHGAKVVNSNNGVQNFKMRAQVFGLKLLLVIFGILQLFITIQANFMLIRAFTFKHCIG